MMIVRLFSTSVLLLLPSSVLGEEDVSKKFLIRLSDANGQGDVPSSGSSARARCSSLASRYGGKVVRSHDFGGGGGSSYKGCSLALPTTLPGCDARRQNAEGTPGYVEACMRGGGNDDVTLVEEDALAYAIEILPGVEEGAGPNLFNASSAAAPIWNLDRIDQCHLPLDNVPYVGGSASRTHVFVLDTGIRMDHEEFSGGTIDPGSACHLSLVDYDVTTDIHGHGTHVAGTACGHRYGVASECSLCAVKVLNSAGFGSYSGIISGIEHVVSYCTNPTRNTSGKRCVINMSLGGGKSVAINDAVASAVASGVVVVVAAGNNNADACLYSPASAVTALTVGATNVTDGRSYFSNYGGCVDVYAPGESIESASSSSATAYVSMQGTSMAAPHVAGIAATLLTTDPSLTPHQVSAMIVSSATYLLPERDIPLATIGLQGVNCWEGPTRVPTMSPTCLATSTRLSTSGTGGTNGSCNCGPTIPCIVADSRCCSGQCRIAATGNSFCHSPSTAKPSTSRPTTSKPSTGSPTKAPSPSLTSNPTGSPTGAPSSFPTSSPTGTITTSSPTSAVKIFTSAPSSSPTSPTCLATGTRLSTSGTGGANGSCNCGPTLPCIVADSRCCSGQCRIAQATGYSFCYSPSTAKPSSSRPTTSKPSTGSPTSAPSPSLTSSPTGSPTGAPSSSPTSTPTSSSPTSSPTGTITTSSPTSASSSSPTSTKPTKACIQTTVNNGRMAPDVCNCNVTTGCTSSAEPRCCSNKCRITTTGVSFCIV